MAKIIRKVRHSASELRKEVLKQMLALSTSAFGLIAALAWNEVIKELIDGYIKPLVGGASKMLSLLIYAVLVTTLAVLVTYSLSKITKKA
jgi:uncharacterized membrane protein (DUF106 family)